MNRHFIAFIDLGKTLAQEKGLIWDFPIDDSGSALDGIGWNLTQAVNDVAPSAQYLRDLGLDAKVLIHINAERISNDLPEIPKRPLSPAWRDLIKAAVAEQLFYKRNTTANALANIARPLKVMASCVDAEPWALTTDQLNQAIAIGIAIQASGKLGISMTALVKNLFDENHLFDSGPLFGMIQGRRQKHQRSVKAKHTMSDDELRTRLEDRKREEKLPSKRAFWELTRIVFTEQPRTFSDELKFAAVKTMILTGLRIGEVALLPVDWKRERHYFDDSGRPAAASGGMSSGMSIRHFAEKQQVEMSDSRILRQGNQYVPEIFREILSDSLGRIEHMTAPLRKTIQMQFDSGRLLPWYSNDELVPFTAIYTRLSGNPFWLKIDRDSFLTRYRTEFDPVVLYELDRFQSEIYREGPSSLDSAIYVFGNRLLTKMRNGETLLRFRSANGSVIDPRDRMIWARVFLHVGELEQYIREKLPTKVSDLSAVPTDSGPHAPWQFLFLHPKRSLAEERNDGICDVTKYAAVGRPDSVFISSAVGDHPSMPSLFHDYASTEPDRALSLTSHTLRHLQNTELFRLGIADTIISKRYNRRSVAQSYEYDHRSLAEELDEMDLPGDIEAMLGPKASTVAKMILGGKASGPIVDAFKRIQAEDGDIAAFEYLRVEADGFHATPYGHCLNSFTVDPCPKHLECFAGCRHLSATDLPENRENLMRLEEKFKAAIITIKSRPSSSIGWNNQLQHAEKRLVGVQALLTTKPGELVFPDGQDFSTAKQASLFDF